MKTFLFLTIAAGVLAIAPAIAADGAEALTAGTGDMSKLLVAGGPRKTSAAAANAASGNSLRLVVGGVKTIQAGTYEDYGEVPADFSGADNLAVSLNASAGSLSGVTVIVGFAAYGEYFTVADLIRGATFPDGTSGGARVPVYGPSVRIFVANDGKAPVTVRQLAVYSVMR